MKQVIENYRSGDVSVQAVPAPTCRPGTVLVQTKASLISAGTESAAVSFGRKSLLQKARSRPDLVKQVLDKVRTDGLVTTYRVAKARLDVPLALGYSSSGAVIEVGAGVDRVGPGDRVACAGAGYASHAEVVAVPKNLVVPIPNGVAYEDAAFGTVGAVALQGLRVADLRIGERVVVVGLGLIGLLTVQLLKASGCKVFGTDLHQERVSLARDLGADESRLLDRSVIGEALDVFTSGRGADAVIITAATSSSEPIELAGEWARLKGRVVVVGDVGMYVPRKVYYDKELELRVSRSYGPGRYDPNYEERGLDYPYAYVPFTEQRNIETFLNLVAEGKITPGRLVTHRFAIEEAERAYSLIKGEGKTPFLGVLLNYPGDPDPGRRLTVKDEAKTVRSGGNEVIIGVIGAGNYARSVLLPSLKVTPGVRLAGVCTTRGLNAWQVARHFGFEFAATDPKELLDDDRIQAVMIATRHDSHASLAQKALLAGKHVFVEKPLATTEADLSSLVNTAETSNVQLSVGFNRRFAPLIRQFKAKFWGHGQPLAMIYRVNAGAIPTSHWIQDPNEGGGRIVGEVCHFVDLLQHICGAAPVSVYAVSASGDTGGIPPDDIVSITIRFADGSLGSIHYFANGNRTIPKEYLEIYGGGKVFILDDFRRAKFVSGGKVENWRLWRQDKGQTHQLQAVVSAIQTGSSPPIPLSEVVRTTLTTFRILDSLRLQREIPIGWSHPSTETHSAPDTPS